MDIPVKQESTARDGHYKELGLKSKTFFYEKKNKKKYREKCKYRI